MAAVAPVPPRGTVPEASPAAGFAAGTGTAGAALTAGAAFRSVFNWTNVAVTFYLCVVLVVARSAVSLVSVDLDVWASSAIRYLRQTLISGNLVLLAIACTHAVVAPRGWARRPAFLLAAGFTTIGASIAIVVRWIVADAPLSRVIEMPAYPAALVVLWMSIGTLGYAIFYLMRESERSRDQLCEADTRREALQAQIVQANLSALQAQIEPHFLFNTLANVKRLYETSPAVGREMLLNLIGYLRAALPSMRRSGSTVQRELELVRAYLTILRLRMGERLVFSIDCDAGLADAVVPPMMLPTLVENSIKHGLQPLTEGGRIDIRVRRHDNDLRIEVSDTGAGFRASSGSGVGLANIRSRLSALYGPRGMLTLCAAEPRGVIAALQMPLDASSTAVTAAPAASPAASPTTPGANA